MKRQLVITIDENIPETQVMFFLKNVNFIKSVYSKKRSKYDLSNSKETSLLAEELLAKDWLLPEEDEAWNDL